MSGIAISNIVFSAASDQDVEAGLLAWIACTVNNALRLDGLTLRRMENGKLTISFPARRDSSGRQHFFIRPLDDVTRREIERQIVEAIRFGATAP